MSPAQCRAARAMLGIDQSELASSAGVSRSTLIDFEAGSRTPRGSTLDAIRAALEAAGVQFIAQDNGGPGVRLKNEAAKAP